VLDRLRWAKRRAKIHGRRAREKRGKFGVRAPGYARSVPPGFIKIGEVATLLGVSYSSAVAYARRDDFPAPDADRSFPRGRVWRADEVERWGSEHLVETRRGRAALPRPGRPRKRDA
jgi:hypothetical protein